MASSYTGITPAVVEAKQTTVIGILKVGQSDDPLSLKQTAGSGILSLGPLQAGGTRQVIYTAPATVGKGIIDPVSFKISRRADRCGGVRRGQCST